jgi:hypothetical protein
MIVPAMKRTILTRAHCSGIFTCPHAKVPPTKTRTVGNFEGLPEPALSGGCFIVIVIFTLLLWTILSFVVNRWAIKMKEFGTSPWLTSTGYTLIMFPSGLALVWVVIFISGPQDEEIGVSDGQDLRQEAEPLEFSDSSDPDEKDFGL